jgi:hypothetical protein
MDANRNRARPAIEPLEARLAMSGGAISVARGNVATPRAVATIELNVPAADLQPGHAATTFDITLLADPTTGLVPQLVSIKGPDGRRLAVQPASAIPIGSQAQFTFFVKDSLPGPLTAEVTGQAGTTGGFSAEIDLTGDLNGDGRVNLADLALFAPAYFTHRGGPNYNPRADVNNNGIIGMDDAFAIERNVVTPGPPRPLTVDIRLAPVDQIHGHTGAKNSGGITYHTVVTIVGKTTPGSIVLTDGPAGDYTFTGPFLFADTNGSFAIRQSLPDGLTNTEFTIVDPAGHRLLRAFPILRLGF